MSKAKNVRSILEKPDLFEWSVQGFGMLRAYLTNTVRLQLWDSQFRVPEVSMIHDHPWHFSSVVLVGRLVNRLYSYSRLSANHRSMLIQCGGGGGCMQDPEAARYDPLSVTGSQTYGPGDSYKQSKHEIHKSEPEDGTLTLVTRIFDGNPDIARVFWPIDTEWVSAEPRPASPGEVASACERSLSRWF